MTALCRLLDHSWRRGKWGGVRLDARACRRCLRVEIWAYGDFRLTSLVAPEDVA